MHGRGSHAARPEDSHDPIIAMAALVQALQTIVSRNVRPLSPAVLSVTKVQAGSAYNVVPDEATLAGTVRYLDRKVSDQIQARMREVAAGIAAAFSVEVEVDFRNVFDVLVNTDALIDGYLAAARDVVGDDDVYVKTEPVMGSEDFADMLEATPGVYCTIGHAASVPLHNPGFVLDDGIPAGRRQPLCPHRRTPAGGPRRIRSNGEQSFRNACQREPGMTAELTSEIQYQPAPESAAMRLLRAAARCAERRSLARKGCSCRKASKMPIWSLREAATRPFCSAVVHR